MLWKSAPTILNPTALNRRGARENIDAIASVLARPPPRLRMKPGPGNVPANNEPRTTRISVTMTAARVPQRKMAVIVIMFARPSLIHGIGEGSKVSNP